MKNNFQNKHNLTYINENKAKIEKLQIEQIDHVFDYVYSFFHDLNGLYEYIGPKNIEKYELIAYGIDRQININEISKLIIENKKMIIVDIVNKKIEICYWLDVETIEFFNKKFKNKTLNSFVSNYKLDKKSIKICNLKSQITFEFYFYQQFEYKRRSGYKSGDVWINVGGPPTVIEIDTRLENIICRFCTKTNKYLGSEIK